MVVIVNIHMYAHASTIVYISNQSFVSLGLLIGILCIAHWSVQSLYLYSTYACNTVRIYSKIKASNKDEISMH